jgi:putative sigma-54 modulation protein
MKITIKVTGLELTPSIQEYAEKRVESLEKFIHTNSESALAQIEVGMVSRHHKSGDIFRAEVKLSVDGQVLYAEAEKDDLYASIDEMHDKMERELVSLKNKKKSLTKRGEAVVKKILRRSK